jgi:hypothetical protein
MRYPVLKPSLGAADAIRSTKAARFPHTAGRHSDVATCGPRATTRAGAPRRHSPAGDLGRSASNEARDRNRPIKTHQNNLQRSLIDRLSTDSRVSVSCFGFAVGTGSPGEGQRPAVPSGTNIRREGACSMPRATGWTHTLLPSAGSLNSGGASDEFFGLRDPGGDNVG